MSTSERAEMIKNLDEMVIPVLRQLNFKGSFPHFRRITQERIHLLTFQFDRNGGGFVIEIANANPAGYKTTLDKPIPPKQLTAHNLDVRKRIQSNMKTMDSSTDDWFRYDKKHLLGFGTRYKKVCKEVLSKLTFADEYWKNGPLN